MGQQDEINDKLITVVNKLNDNIEKLVFIIQIMKKDIDKLKLEKKIED